MANTAKELRIKSENLKNGIAPLLKQLVTTNLEIDKQIDDNNAIIAQANANIEQLYRENESLPPSRVITRHSFQRLRESSQSERISKCLLESH